MEPAHWMAVRYCESTMRRSSSFARGSAEVSSMAAPEFQKLSQYLAAAVKNERGSSAAAPLPLKPQQNARLSVVEERTKRCGASRLIAAAPSQAIRTI